MEWNKGSLRSSNGDGSQGGRNKVTRRNYMDEKMHYLLRFRENNCPFVEKKLKENIFSRTHGRGAFLITAG